MDVEFEKIFSRAREKALLMIPGPTEIPWRVVLAMMKPSFNHHDPKFNVDVLDNTLIKLRQVFQTQNEIIAVPGSGRVGQQAAINSVVEPGDKVLSIVAGIFGGWMKEMARRIGAEVEEYSVEWGASLDLEKVEKILQTGKFKALTVVHNETTTGAMYPIGKLGRLTQKYQVLFIVDSVSSLGGVDIRTDEWGIDINLTASHKCIASPIGLALMSISQKAWTVMEKRRTPAVDFAYDLYRWKRMWIPPERGGELIFGFRRQPITMPVHLVFALQEAVRMILEESIANRFRRHHVAAEAVRNAVQALGLRLFPEKEIASDTVTAVNVPEGVDCRKVTSIMQETYGVMMAAGLEKLATRIWRIPHMGMTASPDFTLPTLNAFERALISAGYPAKLGKGVEAASDVFNATPVE